MTRARIADKANQLQKKFLQTDAELVDVDMFLPAKSLLDLYGEDMRSRAYIAEDSILGDNILRPDFTVPIAEYHLGKAGVGESRYCYNGPVWRKHDTHFQNPEDFPEVDIEFFDTKTRGMSEKPREVPQVGIEVFGATDPSLAEADIFTLFFNILKGELGQNLSVVTGDVGLLRAAINGLNTTPARRRALMRHLWHPQRFRQLLLRFSGKAEPLATRAKLIEQINADGFDSVINLAGTPIGKRDITAIKTRVDWLIEDAKTPPLDAGQAGLIDDILALNTNAADALKHAENWTQNHPYLASATARMSARLKAFEGKNIALKDLGFEGCYALTSLEYYDGFVFRFTDKAQNILATGGRYDALVDRLGGKKITAIGGVIRPDILLQATGG